MLVGLGHPQVHGGRLPLPGPAGHRVDQRLADAAAAGLPAAQLVGHLDGVGFGAWLPAGPAELELDCVCETDEFGDPGQQRQLRRRGPVQPSPQCGVPHAQVLGRSVDGEALAGQGVAHGGGPPRPAPRPARLLGQRSPSASPRDPTITGLIITGLPKTGTALPPARARS